MPQAPKNIVAKQDATYKAGVNAPAYKNTRPDLLEKTAELLTPDLSPIRRAAHDLGTLLGVNTEAYQMTGGDAVALAIMAIPAGTKARTAKKEVMELTHYSTKPREVLRSAFQGSSPVVSQELAAGIPKNRVINFYNEALGAPERMVTAVAPFKHTIKGKFAVLDISSPEGIAMIRQAQDAAAKKVNGNALSELNAIIKKAGYDVYHNSEFNPNNFRFVGEQIAVPKNGVTNIR